MMSRNSDIIAYLDKIKVADKAKYDAGAGERALNEQKEKLAQYKTRIDELVREMAEVTAATAATQSQRKKAEFAT
jgi:hypothetical protein